MFAITKYNDLRHYFYQVAIYFLKIGMPGEYLGGERANLTFILAKILILYSEYSAIKSSDESFFSFKTGSLELNTD